MVLENQSKGKSSFHAKFLKSSIQGAVPAIKDGDFTLTESHVIMKYLCNKHGETSLYPSDPVKRAKIDEALARVADIKFGCFLPKLFGWEFNVTGLSLVPF